MILVEKNMSDKTIIPLEEMHFFNLISIDEVGEVFEWKGRIFRGITEEAKPLVDRYFSSGFLDCIVEKGYFPKTDISTYTNPKYCYILEHERIDLQTVDAEWSFDMLKDAALLVCEVAQIAWGYGFNMKDCHTKNVLFRNNKPIYVDLGSFVFIEEGTTGFKSYEQIFSYYYYVLRLWSDGCMSLPKQLQGLYRFEKRDYLLYRYPLFRYFQFILDTYLRVSLILFLLTTSSYVSSYVQKNQFRMLLWKILNNLKLFRWQKPQCFKKMFLKIKTPRNLLVNQTIYNPVKFGDEFSNYIDKKTDLIIVNPCCYGFLDTFIERFNKNRIITIDYIDSYGNSNYLKLRNSGKTITCLSFNMSYPLVHYNYYSPPQKRLKAPVMVVVGPREIVNYQKKPIEVFFRTIMEYNFDYLIVIEKHSCAISSNENNLINTWYDLLKTITKECFIISFYRKK